MKKILIIVLSLLMLCGCSVTNVSKTSYTPNIVVIDAGHGGKDVGTIGIDGNFEKDINLSIALDLYDFLSVSGMVCKLTRAGDYEFYKNGEQRIKSDLYNRLDYINSFENSNLISIHQNHFEDQSQWGCQVWYSANTDKSKVLADKILNSVKNNLQPDNSRENKESDNSYYLLYKATVPSVMVECGFMSNNEDNKKLQNEKYQREFAYAILEGVCEEL